MYICIYIYIICSVEEEGEEYNWSVYLTAFFKYLVSLYDCIFVALYSADGCFFVGGGINGVGIFLLKRTPCSRSSVHVNQHVSVFSHVGIAFNTQVQCS